MTFFSRGAGCVIHSWHLNNQNIQVPCIGQYACEALKTCPNLCDQAINIKRPQCVCYLCYENLDGHIYHHSGIRGKKATTYITEKLHADNITKGFKFIGNLLINITQIKNNKIKENILIKTLEILLPLTFIDSTTTTPTNESIDHENQEKIILDKPSSLFMIKFIFIKIFKEKETKKDVEINDFKVNIFFYFLFLFFQIIFIILIFLIKKSFLFIF